MGKAGNVRGSIFMIISMAGFALEDMFIKGASSSVPVGEILMLFGLGGTCIFALLTHKRKEMIVHPAIYRCSLFSLPLALLAETSLHALPRRYCQICNSVFMASLSSFPLVSL